MKNINFKIDYLEKELERLLSWISAAESKLNLIIPLATAMLSTLAIIAADIDTWDCFGLFIAILTSLFLVLCLIFATFATFPRTNGPLKSIIFFGRISEKEMNVYVDNVSNFSEEDYFIDLVKQCHRNSEIANKKYSWVRRAMICLLLSLTPWVISLYYLYNHSA